MQRDYGFNMSQLEVAQAIGLSVQRVKQIEAQALKKAKAILEQRGYKVTDFYDPKGAR